MKTSRNLHLQSLWQQSVVEFHVTKTIAIFFLKKNFMDASFFLAVCVRVWGQTTGATTRPNLNGVFQNPCSREVGANWDCLEGANG